MPQAKNDNNNNSKIEIHELITSYNSIHQILLSNDASTYKKLNHLFLLPEAIHQILSQSSENFSSIESVKLFLLTKFKDIVALASPMQKEFFISQLNLYIQYWLVHNSIPNRFTFFNECSLQCNGKSAWIKGLGHLQVDNPILLSHQVCQKWKFYIKRFDIVKIGTKYFVEIAVFEKDSQAITRSFSIFNPDSPELHARLNNFTEASHKEINRLNPNAISWDIQNILLDCGVNQELNQIQKIKQHLHDFLTTKQHLKAINKIIFINQEIVQEVSYIRNHWSDFHETYKIKLGLSGMSLQEITRTVAADHNKRHQIISKIKNLSTQRHEFQLGVVTTSFLHSLETYLNFIDKVSSKFTKTNYDALAGRPVSGGLPSLGKRR